MHIFTSVQDGHREANFFILPLKTGNQLRSACPRIYTNKDPWFLQLWARLLRKPIWTAMGYLDETNRVR